MNYPGRTWELLAKLLSDNHTHEESDELEYMFASDPALKELAGNLAECWKIISPVFTKEQQKSSEAQFKKLQERIAQLDASVALKTNDNS